MTWLLLLTRKHSTCEQWLGTSTAVDATYLVIEWLSGQRNNNGLAVCGVGASAKNSHTMFATREFKRDSQAAGSVAAQLVIE